ncbi:MAG: hypothetical protein ACR2PZ_14015 [Pseudomonadales bacterium]
MKEFTPTDLFALKLMMEAQLEADYVSELNAKSDGAFDFLIGEWDLVRTSFDETGNVVSKTNGSVIAKYAFDGRVIQEDFHNLREDGIAYRGGTALYTYSPSFKQWHVAAIDASTGATSYQPIWIDGEVHYDSVVRLPDREILTNSRIFNISRESYEWEQSVSINGATWFPNYHIANHRRR